MFKALTALFAMASQATAKLFNRTSNRASTPMRKHRTPGDFAASYTCGARTKKSFRQFVMAHSGGYRMEKDKMGPVMVMHVSKDRFGYPVSKWDARVQ